MTLESKNNPEFDLPPNLFKIQNQKEPGKARKQTPKKPSQNKTEKPTPHRKSTMLIGFLNR